MATEMVEYRPGRWAKVVDGRMVGRATPEEVAAWQRAHGFSAGPRPGTAPSNLELDVDLSPGPTPGPARSLDVPLRPAYERRSPHAEPEPPQPRSLEVDLPAPPTFQPGPVQAARPPARRLPPNSPAAGPRADAPAMRDVPPVPAADAPPPASPPVPSTPVAHAATPKDDGKATPRRRSPARGTASEAKGSAPRPAPRRRRATDGDGESAPQRPRRSARSRPAKGEEKAKGPARKRKAKAAAPSAEQPAAAPQPEAEQGPRYWWIWNMRGQPVAAFLAEWVPRYKEKFGREANTVLCHEDDLEAVEACGYRADVSPLLQPGHFYLGHEDE